MALQIVNRDSNGKIKQDYHLYRVHNKRIIEVDKLKEEEKLQATTKPKNERKRAKKSLK